MDMSDGPAAVELDVLGRRVVDASRALALSSAAVRNHALMSAADRLVESAADIVRANALDVSAAETSGSGFAVVDRLRLTLARVDAMAAGLRQVAGLADPVGETVQGWVRSDGLRSARCGYRSG